MLTKQPHRFIVLLLALLTCSAAVAQEKKALSPRNANYDMNVKLDPKSKLIKGEMLLNWINISPDTIRELQFHLYLNAFKNSETTFMRGSRGVFRGDRAGDDHLSWGYTDILDMDLQGTENLTNKIEFIQPNDGNPYDQTVIRVPLSGFIRPGDTINLNIKFESKLPKIFARTGFAGDYFFVGQWFPKIGVYEPAGMRGVKKGGWNCHQFHPNSEFYADFGVYKVNISLPQEYIVGASGVLVNEKKDGSTRTHSFVAEDVIDFAWTASKRFIELEQEWQHVKIKLLIQPEHKDLADRHFISVKAALDYFDKHVGPYPYPNLTIVDPPISGSGSGGMEYPCLITAGSFAKMPKGLRFVEMVTIHEFGHQYFMGIIASNEFEEPWIDEGMTTYFESRIMDATYGKKTSFVDIGGIRIGDAEMHRASFVYSPARNLAESYRYSWQYPHGGYGMFAYNKPATFLNTLHNLVGSECMTDIWKTFYERYKFKHPSTHDFIAIVNEIMPRYHQNKFGENMNWFFDQLLFGSKICDYKVLKVENHINTAPQGMFDKDGKKIFGGHLESDTLKKYVSKVVLKREGEVIMPVEVLIHFENGQEIVKEWNGHDRTFEFTFLSNSPVLWAQVDPLNKLQIDVNLANNSFHIEPDETPLWKYTVKFLFWVQNIIQSVVWFV
jgi:hypothetical protein